MKNIDEFIKQQISITENNDLDYDELEQFCIDNFEAPTDLYRYKGDGYALVDLGKFKNHHIECIVYVTLEKVDGEWVTAEQHWNDFDIVVDGNITTSFNIEGTGADEYDDWEGVYIEPDRITKTQLLQKIPYLKGQI